MKKTITVLLTVFTLLILNSSFLIHNCLSQWQPDVRLTNAPDSSQTISNYAWGIASNGNIVHIVWYDKRDGNFEIYYKRSTDEGINWGADIRLTNDPAISDRPSISITGQVIIIVWRDDRDGNFEIYYKRSTDGGINWGADTRITNNPYDSNYPSVSLYAQIVNVVWTDYRDGINGEIYFKRSTDGGVNWGADTRLTNDPATSRQSSLAVFGSNLHVVWNESRDGNFEIYYKRSTDGGLTWETDTRLTNNTAVSYNPSISVSGQNVHVLWRDNRDGNFEIYYKFSVDGGLNWDFDTRLTNKPFDSYIPSVTLSGQIVHVVWYDMRDGNREIYYKCSTNNGVSWETDTRLTNDVANSLNPSLSVSSTTVHVVWCDDRDGNYEIYYKQNPTGNPIGIQNISTEIPNAYKLNQNYPNPFNPVTKINFDIAKTGLVNLIVYDALGREVNTLVNEVITSGSYAIDFDGTNLSSGVYFYRLRSSEFTDTKRMLMIK